MIPDTLPNTYEEPPYPPFVGPGEVRFTYIVYEAEVWITHIEFEPARPTEEPQR